MNRSSDPRRDLEQLAVEHEPLQPQRCRALQADEPQPPVPRIAALARGVSAQTSPWPPRAEEEHRLEAVGGAAVDPDHRLDAGAAAARPRGDVERDLALARRGTSPSSARAWISVSPRRSASSSSAQSWALSSG